MKTPLLSLVAVLLSATLCVGFVQAAPVNNVNYTLLKDIKNISKIEVYGNVQLYVSDGASDEVKVYNQYYNENALVQSKNGVLRISSYKSEKLIVWVTAKDLRAIAGYDHADIKSFGTISKIELAVELHNNASANLALDVFTASLMLYDNAKADLSGNAAQFSLSHKIGTSLNSYNFKIKEFTEDHVAKPATSKNEDLADL